MAKIKTKKNSFNFPRFRQYDNSLLVESGSVESVGVCVCMSWREFAEERQIRTFTICGANCQLAESFCVCMCVCACMNWECMLSVVTHSIVSAGLLLSSSWVCRFLLVCCKTLHFFRELNSSRTNDGGYSGSDLWNEIVERQ